MLKVMLQDCHAFSSTFDFSKSFTGEQDTRTSSSWIAVVFLPEIIVLVPSFIIAAHDIREECTKYGFCPCSQFVLVGMNG
jgi:hypothetical protein